MTSLPAPLRYRSPRWTVLSSVGHVDLVAGPAKLLVRHVLLRSVCRRCAAPDTGWDQARGRWALAATRPEKWSPSQSARQIKSSSLPVRLWASSEISGSPKLTHKIV